MIELLILICNQEKELKKVLKKYKLSYNAMTYGSGTASLSLLHYFGLDEVKKSIYFSLIPSSISFNLLDELENKLNLKEKGKGIGFTISLTSTNKFLKDNFDLTYKGEAKMNNDSNYELIVTIVKAGYSDVVMQSAKKVGCNGGTVIEGRSLGTSRTIFMNLAIEPEKDIVINIVHKNIKKQVMENINKETGIKTEARGLLISLPINDVIGLDND